MFARAVKPASSKSGDTEFSVSLRFYLSSGFRLSQRSWRGVGFAYTFHNSASARAASDTACFSAASWETPKIPRRGTMG